LVLLSRELANKRTGSISVPSSNRDRPHCMERYKPARIIILAMEAVMGFGKGALLWLIGIPLPIILLLALFMHH
jgi:hypothetical protein